MSNNHSLRGASNSNTMNSAAYGDLYLKESGHVSYARGSINEIETDGRHHVNRSDPPGQKSVYILPGDPEKETYRLSTYLKFPAIAPVDVIVLARHGFYYTGYKDRVKCFSCGAFIQDWNPQDNPRLARWHLQGCKYVLGTETSNQPIGNHKPQFVGTFTSSLPIPDSGYPSTSVSSISSLRQSDTENPLQLFPSYPTRSSFSNGSHTSLLIADSHRRGDVNLLNRQPSDTSLPLANGSIHSIQSNSSGYASMSMPNTLQQTAQFIGGNFKDSSRVKVQGLDLASVTTSSHRILLVQTLDLHKEEDRIKSFANWKCMAVKPEDLAKSGFFYLGNLDRCQCFSCSGVLRNWRYGDCVEDEHRRHFGDCKMVLGREHRNIPLSGVLLTLTEPAAPSPEEKLRLEREFPCLHPVNPHMRNYEARLQTFDQRWPSHKVLATKEHIAKAGFFFLGERDRGKCWYCNGGLQNWDPNDEPFTEHAKWFPGCEYMLRCKGVDFVRNIVQQFPNLKRPTLRRPRFDHRTKQLINSTPALPTQIPIHDPRNTMSAGALLQSYNPSQSEVPSAMVTESSSLPNGGDAIQRVDVSELERLAEQLGIDREHIRRGIQMIRDGEREFRDADEFVNFLMEQQPPQPNPHHQEVVQGSAHGGNAILVHEAAQKRGTDMEVDEERLSEERTSGESSSKMPKTGEKGMLNQLEELENERRCKHCFKLPADTVIIPCGHLSLCNVCSSSAKKCGVCRTKIVNLIKVFLS